MQITITCELNARNLEILKQLIEGDTSKILDAQGCTPWPPEVTPFSEAPMQEKLKPVDEQPKITAQDVKAVCLKLSKAGKQAELKAAFAKFGGKKLSDIAESDFGRLLEELANA